VALFQFLAGGICERHPKLRVVILEAGAGWVPFWLWWLDELTERYRGLDVPELSLRPSEYFRRQCFISAEMDEPTLPAVIDALGTDPIVTASDFPHPEATMGYGSFLDRDDVGEHAKRQVPIAAELIQLRWGGTGQPLTATQGRIHHQFVGLRLAAHPAEQRPGLPRGRDARIRAPLVDPDQAGLDHVETVEEPLPVRRRADGRLRGIVEKPGAGNEPSDLINFVLHWHRDAAALFAALREQYAGAGATDDHYERALAALFADRRYELLRYDGDWYPIKYPWHVLDVMDFYLHRSGEVIQAAPDVRLFPGARLVEFPARPIHFDLKRRAAAVRGIDAR